MTRITCTLSGFNPRRVLGTGTALDTARLRYLLGEYFSVDPRNMHAYVIGEHGDSEFVAWSQAMLATGLFWRSARNPASAAGRTWTASVKRCAPPPSRLSRPSGPTYYGIGMAMVRITRAIFGNESSVLTVSAMLRGEYGQHGVFAGVPCIVGRNGVRKVLPLNLSEEESEKFRLSCETLENSYRELENL